jgi:hypothetical protein
MPDHFSSGVRSAACAFVSVVTDRLSSKVVHSRARLTESSVAQEQREMARGSVHGARRQVADESSLRVGGGGGICATTAIKRSWHASGLNTSRLSLMKPNLAFKRTPNGRPRNGIMLIFTIARPAVWRRLTLRYAPGSYAQIPVERFERRVCQIACDHRRSHRARSSAQPAQLWVCV